MSQNVQFDSDNVSYKTSGSGSGGARGMTGWLVRHGLANSGSGAQVILIGVIVMNVIITYLIINYAL